MSKKVHASGPTQQQKKLSYWKFVPGVRGPGSRSRRRPGEPLVKKLRLRSQFPRGGPDVVLDSAVTGGEGQRSR